MRERISIAISAVVIGMLLMLVFSTALPSIWPMYPGDM